VPSPLTMAREYMFTTSDPDCGAPLFLAIFATTERLDHHDRRLKTVS
jgi:hypothetical protein